LSEWAIRKEVKEREEDADGGFGSMSRRAHSLLLTVFVVLLVGSTTWFVMSKPTPVIYHSGFTESQIEFADADHARLQALVVKPQEVAIQAKLFERSMRKLQEAATIPDATIWGIDGRQILDRYYKSGQVQFEALRKGDHTYAVQIADSMGTLRSAELRDHLSTEQPLQEVLTKRKPGTSHRSWFQLVLAFVTFLLGGFLVAKPPVKASTNNLLDLVVHPTILTDLRGAERQRNIAVTTLLGADVLPQLVPLYATSHSTALSASNPPPDKPAVFVCAPFSTNTERQMEITVACVAKASPPALLWSFRDVTEQHNSVLDLEHKAFHDSLTGLPNRALFRDRTVHSLARAARSESVVSVLFLDLDGFKNVNDSLGHDAGDELIIEMANRLRQLIRAGDTLSRLGGDEFAVLVDDPRPKLADFLASRMLEAIRQPVRLRGQEVFVGASIGIAEAGPAMTSDELLRNADTAMYAAKDRGKNRVERFHTMMFQEATERLELDSELRRALELDQLRLYFQPLISLRDNKMIGFEALLRWFHPERGVVPPDVFIPIAEETGSIVELGRWVMRNAIQQAGKFSPDHPLSINVNVSARQLGDDRLLEIMIEELELNQVPANRLTLEITESVFLDDIEATIARLEQFRAVGIKLAIDDFGTGYSSLSYLHRLPVQSVKIDRSFIANRSTREQLDADPFVLAILDLAKTLGFSSVAEGIETEDQVQWLTEHGCDLGQGYYFARALPAESVHAMIATLLPPVRGLN
jgi:diguanylate cyclase (GGDEF)-like protein